MQLCIIYNFAQLYREGIYRLIENRYDCHWVFGNNHTDIKGLDLSMFKSSQVIQNKYLVGRVYYQVGAPSLMWKYDHFLMLGELLCLSTWIMLVLRRTIFRQKRIYLWSHGWYGHEGLIKRVLKKWYFAMADQVFLYGNHAKEEARQQGYTKDNLVVVHNSLNYEVQLKLRDTLKPEYIYHQHFGNDRPVLLFIGRLTVIKQLNLLIDAVARLQKKYNLVLVGDGEERASLQQQVRDLHVEDVVWFYGASYNEEENAKLIYNADLCVAPGNVGLTAMHSMVYGTPVLTHNDFNWQMPEFEAIRIGETGDFFQYGDMNSLADRIDKWFDSFSSKREIIRQNCFAEIDTNWTPSFQMNIFESQIK